MERTTTVPADGFSFGEVLIVVFLLGIMLVVAVPQLLAPAELDVGVTARQLAVDLRLARHLAIARRGYYVVTLSPAGGPYTSYTVAAQGGADEPDFPKTFPAGLSVTGTDQITFRPSGATTAAATATIAISQGGESALVSVTVSTGFVKVSGP